MTDMLERLGGPHEWGYRDITDGTFIPDNTPFDAFAEIERLRDENARLKAAIQHWPETWESIGKWLRLIAAPEPQQPATLPRQSDVAS